MANLIDWNTLNHKVELFFDNESNVDTHQKAFPLLMLTTLLDVSDEEAEDAVTDGGHDRGVDAVFVDERDGKNSVHVFQFKYVSTFQKSKNNFPSVEIDKLVSFFDDVLDENKEMEETCNPILWSKIQEIWSAFNRKNLSIEVHFCGNMDSMNEASQLRANNHFKKYPYINIHHHSLDAIISLLIDKKTPRIDNSITVVDKDYFDRTDGNVRGMICTIEALELIRIITDPDHPEKVLPDIFNIMSESTSPEPTE